MAYLGLLTYFTAFFLEFNIWIPALEGVPLLEIIMLGTCIMLLPAVVDGRGGRLVFQYKQTLLLGAFFGWSTLGVINMGMDYAFSQIGYQFFKYLLLYCMIVLSLNSLQKIKWALVLLVFLGILIALNALVQHRTGVDLVGQTANWRESIRWVGNFDGSNGLALVFVLLLGISLGFATLEYLVAFRVFGLFSSLLLIYAIYLTGSRGGFLGLLVVLISYLFVKLPHVKLRTFLPLAIIIFSLGIALKPTEEGRGLGESTSSERIELFYQGLQMIKSQPFNGVGVGEFTHSNPVHKQAHNIWLQHISETGIIGVTIYMLMFYSSIRALVDVIKKEKGEDQSVYNIGVQLLVMVIGFFSCAFFLTVSYEIPYTMLALTTTLPFVRGQPWRLTGKDIKIVAIYNIVLLFTIYILVNLFFIVF